MKKFTLLAFLFISISVSGCGGKASLPEGFEVISQHGKVFFVYLHENLLGDKTQQRAGSTILCDSNDLKECEVYMWSKRDIIPKEFPIRNEGSYVHSSFKRNASGEKKYKCRECD